MMGDALSILGIIYIAFALFYLFYSWLDIRREEAEYREFKHKMDEEMERILKELDEDFASQRRNVNDTKKNNSNSAAADDAPVHRSGSEDTD